MNMWRLFYSVIVAVIVVYIATKVWRVAKRQFFRSETGPRRNVRTQGQPVRILTALCMWSIPFIVGYILLQRADVSARNSFAYAGIIALGILGLTFKNYCLYLGEYVAQVTVNPFIKQGPADSRDPGYKIYGRGFWFKFPWELANKRERKSLEPKTFLINVMFRASDGGAFHATGSYNLRPILDRLDIYIGIDFDPEVIHDAVKNLVVAEIATIVASQKTKEVQAHTTKINETVERLFETTDGSEPKMKQIEDRYGVDISLPRLNFVPDAETANSLNSLYRSSILADSATELANFNEKVLEIASVNAGKGVLKVNRNSQTIGFDGDKETALAFASALEKAGPAAAAALALLLKPKEDSGEKKQRNK